MEKPLVSVIVPTYDSSQYLESCLASIKGQTYPHVEAIVVDQSSHDDSIAIARRHGTKIVSLPRPLFYSPPTRSRNAGARAASGEILYHLDSDMELSIGLVQEIVNTFTNQPKLGALVVHEEDIVQGYWSKCKALERRCYWGNDHIESARVVRTEVFEQVGGYDEGLSSGEDFDIHRRYNKLCQIGFCRNVVFHNLQGLSLAKAISKKYQYGKTAASYFQKKEEPGLSILKEEVLCYVKHYRFFLANPLTGIGTAVLKTLEWGAGGLGIMASKSRVGKKQPNHSNT